VAEWFRLRSAKPFTVVRFHPQRQQIFSPIKLNIMAKFITSIELYGAVESDYENLHLAMKKELFVQPTNSPFKSKSHTQKVVEYSREGNISIQEVTNAVFRVASNTGKKYAFTIIKDKNIQQQLQAKLN